MKPSSKSRRKYVKKSQVAKDKSLSKICDFFKVSEEITEPIVKDENEPNNNDIINSKNFYVSELTKLISLENTQEPKEEEVPTAALENNNDGNIFDNVGAPITVIDDSLNHVRSDDGVNQYGTVCTGCVHKEKRIEEQQIMICELDAKFKDMQNRYLKVSAYCTEVNMKYEHLLKVGTRTDQTNGGKESFFDDFFTSNEIKTLCGMSLEKKNDSTFILQCIKFAYKDDLSVLRNKTLTGKPASLVACEEGDLIEVAEKVALTPEKISRIRQLFIERLDQCSIDAIENLK